MKDATKYALLNKALKVLTFSPLRFAVGKDPLLRHGIITLRIGNHYSECYIRIENGAWEEADLSSVADHLLSVGAWSIFKTLGLTGVTGEYIYDQIKQEEGRAEILKASLNGLVTLAKEGYYCPESGSCPAFSFPVEEEPHWEQTIKHQGDGSRNLCFSPYFFLLSSIGNDITLSPAEAQVQVETLQHFMTPTRKL